MTWHVALIRGLMLVGAFTAAATDAHAQTFSGASAIQLPLLRLGIGFLVCALLAVAAAFALRRLTKGGGGLGGSWLAGASQITIAESRRMSMHADICRVICADREYLVVVSAAGVTVLRESALPAPEAAP